MKLARVCLSDCGTVFRLLRILMSSGELEFRLKCRRRRCSCYLVSGSGLAELLSRELSGDGLAGDCVLLPPPPPGDEVGVVELGVLAPQRRGEDDICVGVAHGGYAVVLRREDVFKHIGVFGATGSGKTTTAARLAVNLHLNGFRVLVLDWHGEYEGLVTRLGARCRVLRGSGLPRVQLVAPFSSIEASVDILGDVLELSPHQALVLNIALEVLAYMAGVSTVSARMAQLLGVDERLRRLVETVAGEVKELGRVDVYVLTRVVERMALELEDTGLGLIASARNQSSREVYAALLRRLYSLSFSEYSHLFLVHDSEPLSAILSDDTVVVLDLSTIRSLRIRRLYGTLLLRQLVEEYMAGRGVQDGGVVVVVDEAHNILGSQPLSNLVAESRKYRVGFVVVTQTPLSLPQTVVSNLNTFIIHRMNVRDLEKVTSITHLGEKVMSIIPKLETGEAVVIAPGYPTPVPVRNPGAC